MQQKTPAVLGLISYGAEGGIRTHTGYCPLRPERSASASSTTSASRFDKY